MKIIPFKKDTVCDECGCVGAFDVYGDYLCVDCFNKYYELEEQDEGGEQDGEEKR
jgi:hypothetical protein